MGVFVLVYVLLFFYYFALWFDVAFLIVCWLTLGFAFYLFGLLNLRLDMSLVACSSFAFAV